MNMNRRDFVTALAALAPLALTAPAFAAAQRDPQLDRSARAMLKKLVAGNPAARQLNDKAVAVLIFPKIVKVGFLLGGAYGEGALQQAGETVGYYNSAAASYGMQAGLQSFGYALFFMNAEALRYLDASQGFEIGAGPSIVVVDKGMAKKFSTTTLTRDVYAIIFNQKGLMAGVGIEGSKITKIR
jgi:lipid-binding SYLF domain-containing protein